jgi:predicted nucleic acid-binding protein
MIALDTNILIYSCDKADLKRQQVALELVSSARDGVLLCELEAAVRVHMIPDQRRQGCQISGREFVRPDRLRGHLLKHECIYVDHAVL